MSVLLKPENFIPKWLSAKEIEIRGDGGLKSPTHSWAQSDLVIETVWADYCLAVRDYNSGRPSNERIRTCTKDVFQTLLFNLVGAYQVQAEKDIISNLKFTGNNIELIRQTLRVYLSREPDDVDVYSFMQFIWQVKRKSLGHEVTWHLCLVLSGEQGFGKSYFIKQLLKPIFRLYQSLRVDQLVDTNYYKSYSYKLVSVLDEFQGAEKACIEELKSIITADDVTYRPFFTQSPVSSPQRCTFIGSSNKPVSTLIIDTGMRRFYELLCEKPIVHSDLASIEFLAVWRAVDENRELAYTQEPGIKEELEKRQQLLETPDEIKTFIEEFCLFTDDETKLTTIRKQTLYGDYREWTIGRGHSANSITWFTKKLRAFKINDKIGSNGGKSERQYIVNEDALKLLPMGSYDKIRRIV